MKHSHTIDLAAVRQRTLERGGVYEYEFTPLSGVPLIERFRALNPESRDELCAALVAEFC